MNGKVERSGGCLPSPPNSPTMSRNPQILYQGRHPYTKLALSPSQHQPSQDIPYTNTDFFTGDRILTPQRRTKSHDAGYPNLSQGWAAEFPVDKEHTVCDEYRQRTTSMPQCTPEKAFAQGEEEESYLTASDEDDNEASVSGDKTSAERLAEKRKMKRFRLTHAQTRYLMSEFARQAHPDTVQREKLSRDIPGLSPRQVQVWFQNRRAKLKRHTTEDQERMMRSRALPEDFDFAQTLQSPIGDQRASPGSAMSLTNLSLNSNDARYRSSMDQSYQTIRPPNSMASVHTSLPSSASSTTGSFNLSPVSSINDGSQYSASCYSGQASPLATTPHFMNPFGRMTSLAESTYQPDYPRPPTAERLRADSVVSPTTQTTPSFAGNVQNLFRESRTPFLAYGNPGLDRQFQRVSPLTSPTYHHDEVQTSPYSAAGSSRYVYRSDFNASEKNSNHSLGRIPDGRHSQDSRFPTPLTYQASAHPSLHPNSRPSPYVDTLPQQWEQSFVSNPRMQSLAPPEHRSMSYIDNPSTMRRGSKNRPVHPNSQP